jgi:EAL domain-containing protein (putative c-di-GMP-specific phosphodiesterase class I)
MIASFTDAVDRAMRFGECAVLLVRAEPAAHVAAATARAEQASLLEGLAGPGDVVGRVSDHELGVLLVGRSWLRARRAAERLVNALRAQGHRAWGGLVRYPAHGPAASVDVLVDAERAWRRGRASGRPVVAFSQPIPAQVRRRDYRERIQRTVASGRLSLFGQPILDLKRDRVSGHEVLLRAPDDGEQSVASLLTAAEHLDLMLDLDLWVLEQTLGRLDDDRRLQVNVSGRSLGDARLTGAVERLLRRYPVRPGRLTFEITETAVIGNFTEAHRFADRVRELGCELALDDFGTGYGSFRYLKEFPLDLVKIDGAYVADLLTEPRDQVLVRALVDVCQAYGIRTLAECVQDEGTLDRLRDLGVDYAQGYLIGYPEPLPALTCDVSLTVRTAMPPSGHESTMDSPAGSR